MNYKKAYETALARANAAVRNGMVSQNFVNDIFKIESEDERVRKELIDFIKDAKQSLELQERDNNKWQIEQLEIYIAWLEKQGEQNPAWSEEDEKVLKMIISDYTAISKSFCGHQGKLNWLKSLKERYTWKPSDKQIDDLEYIMKYYPNIRGMVNSIYADLKKLKG